MLPDVTGIDALTGSYGVQCLSAPVLDGGARGPAHGGPTPHALPGFDPQDTDLPTAPPPHGPAYGHGPAYDDSRGLASQLAQGLGTSIGMGPRTI